MLSTDNRYIYISLNKDIEINLSKSAKKQAEIVEYLKKHESESLTNLAEFFGRGAIKALLDKKILLKQMQEIKRVPFVVSQKDKIVDLNFSQKNAIERISEDKTYLLHGVTGSGKTEVYMNLIERALSNGKNAIMLVPIISATGRGPH